MRSITPKKIKKSNLYQEKVKSTITIQSWWRRWRLVPLFSQVLTLEEDFNSTCAVPSSWIFLRNQDISDDLRLYCDWHPTWERRVGKWRFHPPQHLFRTENEEDFLLATLIWSNGVTRTPNSNHGEILYHPVLKTFAIVQDDTRTFSSFTELLRHVHVLHQLELRPIQRAIITIQRAWTSSAAESAVASAAAGAAAGAAASAAADGAAGSESKQIFRDEKFYYFWRDDKWFLRDYDRGPNPEDVVLLVENPKNKAVRDALEKLQEGIQAKSKTTMYLMEGIRKWIDEKRGGVVDSEQEEKFVNYVRYYMRQKKRDNA